MNADVERYSGKGFLTGGHTEAYLANLSISDGKNRGSSPRRPASICSRSGIQFGPSKEYTLDIYGTDLPDESPIALCLGSGGPAAGGALRRAGARLACLQGPTEAPRESLHETVRQAAKYVFGIARENHSRGVYFVGHGLGAYFISKLLADKELFQECPGSYLLQAAYLLAGVYTKNSTSNVSESKKLDLSIQNESARFITSNNASPSKASSSKISIIKPQVSLVDDLLKEHSSFDDRNKLSFICDMSNRSFSGSFDDTKCGSPVEERLSRRSRGIRGISEEAFKTSPIYRQYSESDNACTFEENNDENNACKESFEDIFAMMLDDDETFDCDDAFNDDFTHLRRLGLRIYVFAAKLDGEELNKQSRNIYDRLSEGCDQGDTHFEVKEKMDRDAMGKLLNEEDNFVRRLIRYDIVKHL